MHWSNRANRSGRKTHRTVEHPCLRPAPRWPVLDLQLEDAVPFLKSRSRRGITVPMIAVTLGDPAGIGPEVVAGHFRRFRPRHSRALLIGSDRVITALAESLSGIVRLEPGAKPHELDGLLAARVGFLDTGCRARYPRGRDSKGGGLHAGSALDVACRLARQGVVDGLVTAPISKKSLSLAGYRFTGHTELFARYFKAPDCQMVMVYGDLRVVPLTRHVPLRRVAAAITEERVLTGLKVVNQALKRQFGVRRPHIAVAGLNPHAGEGGLLGREEIGIITPALRRARRAGIRVTGPVPGDALFQQAQSGTFDAFVTMYHDQGLIPFKMLAKRRGVNVTVGLPIVRTSVDHGVAYDIVGKRTARADSLKQAYQLAERLVTRGRMENHNR